MDPLTGVLSRATLEHRLHEEVERAHRYGLPFSLILLDLDHYKSINDAFGHSRGDRLLADFAKRISGLIRKSDVIFRYGGDEFLLLLPNTEKKFAITLAERLLEGVCAQPFHGKPPVFLSISLGVAAYPDDAHTPEALFEKADQRHYSAKRSGRSRVVSEESEARPLLPIDEEGRLIERDEGLHILHRFLKELPDHKRGLLTITGLAGTGKSRFLAEVGKVARLQGFEVFPVAGSTALSGRTFGSMLTACKNWENLSPPSEGKDAFLQGLHRVAEEKGRSGWIFTVDNLAETDWATLDLLRQLIFSPQNGTVIGLAFTARPGEAHRLLPPMIDLAETVELAPLTREGFRISLRMALHWDPPDEFCSWLYDQTNGLPTFMQSALTFLVKQRILERQEPAWVFNHDYHDLSLRDHLGLQNVAPLHTLPAPPTYFVGREREIQDATRLLDESRLLTVIGPGGVGKTRLAIQVAAEMLDHYPQSVYWIPLSAVSSPDFLITAIVESLKLSFYTRDEPETQLLNYLRDRQALLVMDNFEHLTEGAGLLARILAAAPRMRILVTSRERLNIRGEAVLQLAGMSYPAEKTTAPLESFPSVQLFIQSARRISPEFSPSERDKEAVAHICRLVEGLPLGIELAAAWVRVLTCQEIAAEIANNLDFLATQMKDIPERHRSLRAVFEHSWALLLPAEKKVLGKLAVFAGGFRREAAGAVSGASLVHLTALMDKTLLRKSSTGRFEMHEVLRGYAAEKLKENPPEWEGTCQQHAAYYIDLLRQFKPDAPFNQMKGGLETTGDEIENIRAAWRWAVEHCQVERIAQAVDSLFNFYEIRSLFQEGETVFRLTAGALQTNRCSEVSGASTVERLVGMVLARQGVFNHHLSRYDQGQALYLRSLEIFRRHGLRSELAFILQKLGTLHDEIGDYEIAVRETQESLALYQELQDPRGIGRALNELGAIAYQQGEYQKADRYHRESLRLLREIDDRWGIASTLINLANVSVELGDDQQASQLYRESLSLCKEIGSLNGMATNYNNLGDIARENGDYDEARTQLSRSYEIYTEIGDRYGISVALSNLGVVAYHLGQYAEARQQLEESVQISLDTGNRLQLAYALVYLGNISSAEGQTDDALRCFDSALEMALAHQAIPLVLDTVIGVANLLWRTGQNLLALEWIYFALHHPSVMKGQRLDADALRQALEAELSPEQVAGCRSAGQQHVVEDFFETIRSITSPAT